MTAPRRLLNKLANLLARRGLTGAGMTALVFVNSFASAEADREASEKVGGLFRPRDARGMDNPARRRKSD